MGATHSTTVQNATSILSSITFDTIVKVNQECQNKATVVQDQVISVGTSDAVMQSCLAACQAGGYNPSACATLMSNGLNVYNINQNAKVTQITQCTMDSTLINQLQASLTDQINQQLSKTQDGFTDAAKSLIQATSNTNDTTMNSTTVGNFVKQTFTLDATQKAINTVAATQKQALTVANTNNATVHDISNAIQMEAMLTLLQSNASTASAITKIDNQSSQALTSQTKGLTDIVASIADVFKSLFSALGSWIYAIYGLAGLCVICCCLACVALMFSGKGQQAAQVISTTSAANVPPQLQAYLPTIKQAAGLLAKVK